MSMFEVHSSWMSSCRPNNNVSPSQSRRRNIIHHDALFKCITWRWSIVLNHNQIKPSLSQNPSIHRWPTLGQRATKLYVCTTSSKRDCLYCSCHYACWLIPNTFKQEANCSQSRVPSIPSLGGPLKRNGDDTIKLATHFVASFWKRKMFKRKAVGAQQCQAGAGG